MESEFDSSSTTNILKSPGDEKRGHTKSRTKYILGIILVGILGLFLGFAIVYVLFWQIGKENLIAGHRVNFEEKKPGKSFEFSYSEYGISEPDWQFSQKFFPN